MIENYNIIKVGGSNDVEIHETYDLVVDGLNAVRNSVLAGVSPGGGAALLHASKILDLLDLENDDLNAGVMILQRAIREPFRRLIANSGYEESYFEKVLLEQSNINLGEFQF